MVDFRRDAFECMLELMQQNDNIAHFRSVRASKGGRFRDGVLMASYTPEFMRRVNFTFAGGDPEHVPVSLSVFRDDKDSDAKWNNVLVDLEDLKQFVNQAQELIAETERAIGRI